MFSRIIAYFRLYTREDWYTLLLLISILALVLLIPALYFYDYLTSYYGQWEWLKWKFFLTESLQKLLEFLLDKLSRLW